MLDNYRDLIDGLLETPTTVRAALGDPVPETLDPELASLLLELRVRESVNLRRLQSIMRHEPVLLLAMEDEPEIRASAPPLATPPRNRTWPPSATTAASSSRSSSTSPCAIGNGASTTTAPAKPPSPTKSKTTSPGTKRSSPNSPRNGTVQGFVGAAA